MSTKLLGKGFNGLSYAARIQLNPAIGTFTSSSFSLDQQDSPLKNPIGPSSDSKNEQRALPTATAS